MLLITSPYCLPSKYIFIQYEGCSCRLSLHCMQYIAQWLLRDCKTDSCQIPDDIQLALSTSVFRVTSCPLVVGVATTMCGTGTENPRGMGLGRNHTPICFFKNAFTKVSVKFNLFSIFHGHLAWIRKRLLAYLFLHFFQLKINLWGENILWFWK